MCLHMKTRSYSISSVHGTRDDYPDQRLLLFLRLWMDGCNYKLFKLSMQKKI